ncbi:PREDICTED: neuronal membrane glycoprotein M6-a-like isoform X1 [Branchiostoma belcheri]|uniref:Neuronal membrane glycoprotein M6-a-like isoform X1 n=1 Tax=Branchiostoma belcheri TaxID=7741 RepID=A0A6P4Y5P3_BRABE|nr:PREDICTED: neuronal membrane glycoprotein M6-a-like isoform X1 [Branchiostoma belcheri]
MTRYELQTGETEGCCDACIRCLGRIPYASLIATILLAAGIAVFCGSFYTAVIQTRTLFSFGDARAVTDNFNNLVEALKWSAVGITAFMGVYAFILLLIGFLATGASKEKKYCGFGTGLGSRITVAFFLVLTYIIFIGWLLMSCMGVIPSLFFYLTVIVKAKPYTVNGNNCLNLQQFGLDVVFNTTGTPTVPANTNLGTNMWEYCGNDYNKFQADGFQLFNLYIVALVGALVVTISLVHYLMCLSANYAHLKDSGKIYKYEETKYREEQELHNIVTNSKEKLNY